VKNSYYDAPEELAAAYTSFRVMSFWTATSARGAAPCSSFWTLAEIELRFDPGELAARMIDNGSPTPADLERSVELCTRIAAGGLLALAPPDMQAPLLALYQRELTQPVSGEPHAARRRDPDAP